MCSRLGLLTTGTSAGLLSCGTIQNMGLCTWACRIVYTCKLWFSSPFPSCCYRQHSCVGAESQKAISQSGLENGALTNVLVVDVAGGEGHVKVLVLTVLWWRVTALPVKCGTAHGRGAVLSQSSST